VVFFPAVVGRFLYFKTSRPCLETTQGRIHYVQEVPFTAGKELLRETDYTYRPEAKIVRRLTSTPPYNHPYMFLDMYSENFTSFSSTKQRC
jgi:hypothetical protein